MSTHAPARYHGLHLVATPAHEPNSDPVADDARPEGKEDRQLAEGVQKFQRLQDAFAEQVLSLQPDRDLLFELKAELDLLKKVLRARGVRVK